MTVRRWLIAATSAVLIAAISACNAQCESSGGVHTERRYAALDALPDWRGTWTVDFKSIAATMMGPPPALQGKYREAYEEYQRQVRANQGQVASHASHCRPPGMPIIMMAPQYPMEFLFTPGRVTTHHEAWMQWRVIHTDGRTPPEDLDPTFNGYSNGHWEGDVLVVETVAIKTSVDLGMGIKHSGQVRIRERIHLVKGEPDTLLDEMTIEDPEALAQPWNITLRFTRSRDASLLEFVCEENDRNPVDAAGRTGFE